MIVYGDHHRRLDPRDELDRLEAALRTLSDTPAGLRRHATLTNAFVDAAALAQALIDAEAADAGLDALTPLHLVAAQVLLSLAQAVDASWRAGATGGGARAPSLAMLARLAPAGPVDARLAEGFAFYALYPEGHAEAARRLGLDGEARVLGLRTIGLALAAMAAARAGGPAPLSARPGGHPFDRRLSLDPAFHARLAADSDRAWAVADEGPGLSGSSFAAAVAALEAAGVAPERIALLPGHAGLPGAQAGPERRARYAAARRAVVDLDALALAPRTDGGAPLAGWAQDLTGPPLAPLEDLSGGAWRAHLLADSAAWPPVDPARERRKFLLRTGRGAFRLKFAALGSEGEGKLARAQALHAAGFSPATLGLRHGFLVEPWLEDARPLLDAPPDRAAAAARITGYLRLRARAFPAQPWEGADLPALWAMARANAEEALGARAGARLDPWRGRLPDLARGSRRIHVDGRLHLWEWLRLPDSRVLKTDALDHARAHDLIGAQDVAWDVAGAAVELRLDATAEAALAAGLDVPAPRLAFHRLAYLAFQLGLWDQATHAQAGEDAGRAKALRESYAERVARALDTTQADRTA